MKKDETIIGGIPWSILKDQVMETEFDQEAFIVSQVSTYDQLLSLGATK